MCYKRLVPILPLLSFPSATEIPLKVLKGSDGFCALTAPCKMSANDSAGRTERICAISKPGSHGSPRPVGSESPWVHPWPTAHFAPELTAMDISSSLARSGAGSCSFLELFDGCSSAPLSSPGGVFRGTLICSEQFRDAIMFYSTKWSLMSAAIRLSAISIWRWPSNLSPSLPLMKYSIAINNTSPPQKK